jgi:activating signal cointegrator 1
MKALSLMQPWATLVVIGAKRFETRSWQTTHRGLLLIHAARSWNATQQQLCTVEPFLSALRLAGHDLPDDLPRGAVLGCVDLLECLRVDQADQWLAANDAAYEREKSFGDYRPGRWAWRLANPRRFRTPVILGGKLGLFEVAAGLLPEWRAGSVSDRVQRPPTVPGEPGALATGGGSGEPGALATG